jgi:multicomponent Na+:H+ antiporter subunit E
LFDSRSSAGRWGRRCLFFLGLWWVLSEGRPTDWGFGLVVAGVAAAVALPQETGRGIRPAGLLRFAPFFLWQSFVAAVEVARLALSPRLRLRPSLLSYPLRLRSLKAQVFFANTISLLPGTLTADLWEGRLRLHVLASTPQVVDKVAAVEERVAALFGETPWENEHGRL